MYDYIVLSDAEAREILGPDIHHVARWSAEGASLMCDLPKAPPIQYFREIRDRSARPSFSVSTPETGHVDWERPDIWVSVEQTPAEMFRTIAHEIAHKRQHARLQRGAHGSYDLVQRKAAYEREASAFEAEFFSRAFPHGSRAAQAAGIYKASSATTRTRLNPTAAAELLMDIVKCRQILGDR